MIMGVCRATHACFFCPCRGDFQSPESLLFHFLGFGRLEITPTVRENYSEGELLIFIAFSLLVGAIFNRPNHCFFHFLGFGRLEIAPTVREDYSEGKLLIFIAFISCRGDFQSPESLLFSSLLSWAIRNCPYCLREL